MKVPSEAKIVFGEQNIDDVESHVDTYANFLYFNGITAKTPFGIYVDRSPECLFVMLAAIKIGVPFMPIDISLPYDRIHFMIQDSNIKLLITVKKYEQQFNECQTICIDDIVDNPTPFSSVQQKNEIIYILYTSGSSGNPKGVEVRRASFFAFIDGVSKIIDFSPRKCIACLTTMSFDIFFLESIMALYKGLTVVLASDEESVNPRLMSRILINNDVNMVQMTPSRVQLLISYDSDLKCLSNMTEILVGGEPFPHKLLSTLKCRTNAKIYNMYGPTETTIWSTISELTYKNEIDIGVPIDGTRIYIVDEGLNPVSEGIIGEICIAGKGLAKGYINNSKLTAEKFLTLSSPINEQVYRTGDFGMFQDGVYMCFGRKDNQIKIRGYRVELEEIENVITQLDGIDQVVVSLIKQETGDALFAFYTSKESINNHEILTYLKRILPNYMIPSYYIKLGNIPQTNSGKINRTQIIETYNKMCEMEKLYGIMEKPQVSQNQSIEEQILGIIAEHTDTHDEITPKSDFSSLGLDSISFITVIVALEEKFEFVFDDDMLLFAAYPNIEAMISYVKSKIRR